MNILYILRMICGTICLAAGCFVIVTSVIGIYKFKFCLNRLHSAAMGDTLGVFFIVAGTVFMRGIGFSSLKMILLLILFWVSCPVTSHVLVKMQLETDQEAVAEESEEIEG